MNENRNFNEDFEIEQAGPEDVGCDLFEYELTPEGTYVPKIAYTSDPEEEKLLKKPIRRWGRAWMKWMEAEYPADVDILVCECRWQIIPREIDIEAEERFDELDEIYRKDHPRPTEFNAIRKWEKERLMMLEHQVMEEIVYKLRE